MVLAVAAAQYGNLAHSVDAELALNSGAAMKPDGGPAFPSHGTMGEVAQQGMSLRDYFAAAALQGILGIYDQPNQLSEQFAERCYRLADAMLAEREKS